MKLLRGKTSCEICGETDRSVLDRHHIIPRCDPRSTDDLSNLALLCASDHRRVHAGEIIIEGVYATSTGLQLIIHQKGEPYHIRPGIIFGEDGYVHILEK